MEMEVVVPPPLAAVDFHFDSTSSSPFITAPSTPERFGNFFLSAPSSPSHSFHSPTTSAVVADSDLSSSIPFNWEEKPGTPKNRAGKSHDRGGVEDNDDDDDFEFDFSGQLERASLSAEELFDGGKIRPLKPPPGYDQFSAASSPRSPKSPRYRVSKKNEFDPFAAALEQTRKSVELEEKPVLTTRQRGRQRTSGSSSSSTYVHKGSRSLSPFRVSDIMLETEQDRIPRVSVTVTSSTSNTRSYASSIFSSISFSKTPRKWSFKDFLLFRSASEGRASNKDPVAKYAMLSKKEPDEVNNSSFRWTESGGSFSRRRGRVSAHELHYTVNRAVSEEMKRKTFLPYKQGLLGCLGFSPGGCGHEISRGVGSMTRR